mmetsp:Transcript_3391/g.2949  ORF Transcript_3391/g.2949 Transcript_3391/m.2949 type:complete len:118 (+) Transcript_3391:289-642(+)
MLKKGSKLVSIDVNEYTTNIAKQLADHAGLSDMISYRLGGLEKNVEDFKKTYGTFDFVFLDHWKDLYLSDAKLLETTQLIKKGTCMFGDNILYPGCPDFRKYVGESDKYQTKEHDRA